MKFNALAFLSLAMIGSQASAAEFVRYEEALKLTLSPRAGDVQFLTTPADGVVEADGFRLQTTGEKPLTPVNTCILATNKEPHAADVEILTNIKVDGTVSMQTDTEPGPDTSVTLFDALMVNDSKRVTIPVRVFPSDARGSFKKIDGKWMARIRKTTRVELKKIAVEKSGFSHVEICNVRPGVDLRLRQIESTVMVLPRK